MIPHNPQSATRKIWISEIELQSLMTILGEELSNHPDDFMLRALHDEVAVARQRFSSTTDHPEAVAKALGQKDGNIPLSLSLNEASYLCGIAKVTENIRQSILRGLL